MGACYDGVMYIYIGVVMWHFFAEKKKLFCAYPFTHTNQ